jgi:hypothetical protein
MSPWKVNQVGRKCGWLDIKSPVDLMQQHLLQHKFVMKIFCNIANKLKIKGDKTCLTQFATKDEASVTSETDFDK